MVGVLGRLASPSRRIPVTLAIRGFASQAPRPLLFSCTTKTSTKITSRFILPTSVHFRSYSSSPVPTSSTQPVYSQTDDTLAGTARDITPIPTDLTTPSLATDTTPITTTTPELTDAATTAAEGSEGFLPVTLLTEFLTWVHQSTGMPWWLTIMAATATVRITLIPLMAYVMRNNVKMAELKPIMDTYTAKAQMSSTPEQRAAATAELYALMGRHGINPMKAFLPVLAQAPVFMLFYFTLRRLTENNIDHMDTGGALWFTDLTVPDPYYVLSLCTACAFLLSVELGAETGQSMAQQATLIKNIFRFMAVIFIPITATFQAGLVVYWGFNSLLSFVQMLFFRVPAVRRLFKIPKAPVNTAQAKVHIPPVIFSSPPGTKDRKPINNTPKK